MLTHSLVVEDRMEVCKTEARETCYLTIAMCQVHVPEIMAVAVSSERRK